MGKAACDKTCDAVNGITAEADEVMEDFKGQLTLEAGILAAAQAAEYYETSRYGSLIACANAVGLKEPAELMAEIATDSPSPSGPGQMMLVLARSSGGGWRPRLLRLEYGTGAATARGADIQAAMLAHIIL